MKLFLHFLIYLPAVLFWVPFALFYRIANKLIQNDHYMVLFLFNIRAVDEDAYELSSRE